MSKINIVFITGNDDKRKEVNAILGHELFAVINIKLNLPEIQSLNVIDVVNNKISVALDLANNNFNEIQHKFKEQDIYVNDICDIIIICEDTGLTINNINNFPGALIKYYYECIGNKGISERDGGSQATTICVIGIIKYGIMLPPIIGIRSGTIASKIDELHGIHGFGWDPIFIPDLSNTEFNNMNGKSYAELSNSIKNTISHRSIAFNKLKHILL